MVARSLLFLVVAGVGLTSCAFTDGLVAPERFLGRSYEEVARELGPPISNEIVTSGGRVLLYSLPVRFQTSVGAIDTDARLCQLYEGWNSDGSWDSRRHNCTENPMQPATGRSVRVFCSLEFQLDASETVIHVVEITGACAPEGSLTR